MVRLGKIDVQIAWSRQSHGVRISSQEGEYAKSQLAGTVIPDGEFAARTVSRAIHEGEPNDFHA